MKEEKQVLYVGIQDPLEIKRTVLESSRVLLEGMKRFENYKVIRDEKIKTIHELNVALKDIHKMVSKLRQNLPKVHVNKASEKKTIEKKEPEQVKKEIKHFSEIEKIENELKEIEDKLSRIS